MRWIDLSFRFDAWYAALPRSPRNLGRVHRVVLRTGPGQRATPGAIQVDPDQGAVGDTWLAHGRRQPGNAIALINLHVLRAVCDGEESRMPLAGDQVIADLDLSEANLPVGTLLRIGTCELRVSDVPHRPCASFVARFGANAAKQVARANRKGQRGRGVMCSIVRGGTIRDGDAIAVERPGR